MNLAILSLRVQTERDVVSIRQPIRQITEGLGFDRSDQIRLMAVVLEVVQEVLDQAEAGNVEFSFVDLPLPTLVIQIKVQHPFALAPGMGMAMAQQWLDRVAIDIQPNHTTIHLSQALPPNCPAITQPQIVSIAQLLKLQQSEIHQPEIQQPELLLSEIRQQNRDLLHILGELPASHGKTSSPITHQETPEASQVSLVEEALQAANAEMKAVFAAMDDLIFILDAEGRYLKIPAANPKLIYRSVEERIGKKQHDIFPKEIADTFSGYIQHCLTTQQTLNIEYSLTFDGREIWSNASISPLSADTVIWVARDITRRKQIEQALQQEIYRGSLTEMALRESERRYATLTQMAPVGIFRTDPQGNCLYVNERWCEITSLTAEAALGTGWIRSLHLDDRDRVIREWNQSAAQNLPFTSEYRFQSADGSVIWVFEQAVSEKDADGNLIGYIGTLTDITQLKQAEEVVRQLNASLYRRAVQLKATNQELEAFSYSISHDLRTPLRSMNGFAHLLLDEYAEQLPQIAQTYLQRIQSATRHMYDLIDDMLMLSRISRSEMLVQQVNLSEIACEILTELQQNQGDRSVEFHVTSGLVATGDQRLLRIVLDNLLRNAWKFTSGTSHAQIEFGVVSAGDAVKNAGELPLHQPALPVYYIRDNGAGFDMTYADQLFIPFQRLHEQSEFEGTGIGLAIVYRSIHRHHGRIWAKAAVDQGATFYFTLELSELANLGDFQ